MMEEYFVSYEQALRLKELGFDWKCHYHYDTTAFKPVRCPNYTANDGEGEQWIYADDCNLYEDMNHCQYCSAPTLTQVQRWFREVKGIDIDIRSTRIPSRKYGYVVNDGNKQIFAPDNLKTYEEALSAGIDAAFTILY